MAPQASRASGTRRRRAPRQAPGFTDVTGANGGVAVTIPALGLSGSGGGGLLDFGALVNDGFHTWDGVFSVDVSGLLDGRYAAYLHARSNGAVVLGNGDVNDVTFASISGGDTLTANLSYVTLADVLVAGGALTVTGAGAGRGFLYRDGRDAAGRSGLGRDPARRRAAAVVGPQACRLRCAAPPSLTCRGAPLPKGARHTPQFARAQARGDASDRQLALHVLGIQITARPGDHALAAI